MKLWKGKFLLIGMIFLVSACFVLPVMAGDAVQEKEKNEKAEEQAHKAYELEIMTVTAEKREENIQEVPVSISALSDIQIEDAGIVSIQDMALQIPNLHVMTSGVREGSTVIMRGMPPAALYNPTVGLYVDDVSYSLGSSFDTEFFDIERIEVLRGPQGTLYGKNTMAGVINIITQKPGNQWNGKASVGYGNYSSQDYRAAIRGPLVKDKLFLGLSGVKAKRDGFVDNSYLSGNDDERDGTSGRAHLRWLPADNLDITLSADGDRVRDGTYYYRALNDLKHEIDWDHKGYFNRDVNGQSLRVVYDSPWFKLTSITACRDNEYEDGGDIDMSPADIMYYDHATDYDQCTQEGRLSSLNDAGHLKWLVGTYYFDENRDSQTTYHYGEDAVAMGWAPDIMSQHQLADVETDGYAFFGQATYTLFERLGLTAGIRYDHESKELEWKAYTEMAGTTTPGGEINTDRDYDEWLPKFVIDYQWTPCLMTYANIAEGCRSGDFNNLTSDPASISYDPEYSWNYEVGMKSSWLDNRLIANVSAFYIDWKDQQYRTTLSLLEWVIKNAGESTSKGFEVELTARPVTGVNLSAGFGYSDAKFDQYSDPIFDPMTGDKIGENNYDGKRIPSVPLYTYSLAAQYRHPLGVFARMELQGLGKTYWDEANTQEQSAYELVNARLGYEIEHFEVYLWAKNLFDKEYATNGFNMGGATYWGRPGNPQTFGITLTGRF